MNKALIKIKNATLKTELFVNLMLLVVIAVLVVGGLGYFIARDALQEQIVTDLALASINKESHVYEFLGRKRSTAAAFSTDGRILENLRKINEGDSRASANLEEHLVNNKIILDLSIFGTNVLDAEGFVVASTDERELGEFEFHYDFIDEVEGLGFGEAYISNIAASHHFDENIFSFKIFSPVIDSATGEKLGYVVVYTDASDLNDVMSGVRRMQLGATAPREDPGETLVMYLVNNDGLMIAKSDRVDARLLSQKVNTEPVQNCERNNPTNDAYLNYNNTPVVGASACLVNGWTLVVEIDQEEAFAGIADIQRSILAVMAILLLLAAILAYLLVKKNVGPIYRLLGVVEEFKKGNLSERAEVKNMNEVGQLTDEFNNMADKLQELDLAKNEFISLASHQLKNPLSVISINSELLEGGKDTTEEHKEYIQDIKKSVNSLDRSISALLDVSRIEADVFDFKLENIDLTIEIDNAIKEFESSIATKNIKVTKEWKNKGSLVVKSDRGIVGVALENVIFNSVKYTSNNGKITIGARKKNNEVVVSVKDTGIGIPQKEQNKIFTKLYRASNARGEKYEGTGLGLYMVKKQLEKSGGKIWFESEEGKGTTFYISLPASLG